MQFLRCIYKQSQLSKGVHLYEKQRPNSFISIRSIKTIHALHSALEIQAQLS
ncbi:hypothetical protein EV03_0112 [Prochlorococcus marinus str. PAC1]|uniref:Uncharacterized protein n=1 Tax=Prochlorococcus marinus str. PAC1 TaxID=59924 RepID=A0A0A2CA85_PROMR|nr:hypothetical protein EV03_0112 [Prochlorococcus marinus str. PAC1]